MLKELPKSIYACEVYLKLQRQGLKPIKLRLANGKTEDNFPVESEKYQKINSVCYAIIDLSYLVTDFINSLPKFLSCNVAQMIYIGF